MQDGPRMHQAMPVHNILEAPGNQIYTECCWHALNSMYAEYPMGPQVYYYRALECEPAISSLSHVDPLPA